ncbi:MAG: adenine phosphoribosyltransferase [bacterium]
MTISIENLKAAIRDIPDFPKPGIIFKDITTLLNKKDLLKFTVEQLVNEFQSNKIDYVVGMESRGFIFGVPASLFLGAGFVPIRKPGKLPSKTVSETYQLEYGTDTLEIHDDAFPSGSNILLVDDLLATGGTAEASAKLVEKLGGKITGIAFVIELAFLKGRDKLKNYNVKSLIQY